MPTAEKLSSTKTDVAEVRGEETAVEAVEERADLPEQWLELAKVSRQTAVETVRKILQTVENVPLVGPGLALTERVAHAEYDMLRSIVRSAVGVDVNVGVNVDVLSKGINVDVLSKGVNVNVLSRGEAPSLN
jgi:hypothetical protein